MKQSLSLEYLTALSLLKETMPKDIRGPCTWCADYYDEGDPEPHETPDCLYLRIWNFLKSIDE